MTLSRQYVPAIGKSIKMRQFADYTSRDIHVWSWLRVTAINSDGVTVQVLNGTAPTTQFAHIPYSVVAPPIGWQSQYTIHVNPEKVDAVLGWFERGIVVRQSHDMSGSMPTAFQPMDNAAQTHWQFCEVTDAVPAGMCRKVFRIVKVETEEVNEKVYKTFDPNCEHCNGTGKRHVSELAAIRNASINTTHDQIIAGDIHVNDYDSIAGTFECHCHWGSFSKLGRSKRVKLIKEWAKQGWETRYVPYGGGYWERTRETVVQDWE